MKFLALLLIFASATTSYASTCYFSKGEVRREHKRISQHFSPRSLKDQSLSLDQSKPAEIVIQGNTNFDIFVVGHATCRNSDGGSLFTCYEIYDKYNKRFQAYVSQSQLLITEDLSVPGGALQVETYNCK